MQDEPSTEEQAGNPQRYAEAFFVCAALQSKVLEYAEYLGMDVEAERHELVMP